MSTVIRVMSVVGARPNFIKIAPLIRAIAAHNSQPGQAPRVKHLLVHTGQHYDREMSASFFEVLDIPKPDVDLGVGSGTHAEQIGQTMIAFEPIVREWSPDWVVIVGDVNATCACAITAKKGRVRLAHVEAGLRSFDLSMPEEINRMVADRLSDLLLTTDEFADANLRNEGTPPDRVRRVGNTMIDSLEQHRARAEELTVRDIVAGSLLTPEDAPNPGGSVPEIKDFALLTMHRPSNVDDPAVLGRLVDFLVNEVANERPLLWTLHPRTEKNLANFGLLARLRGIRGLFLLRPVGYLDMMKLNLEARVTLTDSGGLQEECCVLGTPCLTLRWNTERPITLIDNGGVSLLAGNDVERVGKAYRTLTKRPRQPYRPDLWDGHAAERIVRCLVNAAAIASRGPS